jgi:hypothetical protein
LVSSIWFYSNIFAGRVKGLRSAATEIGGKKREEKKMEGKENGFPTVFLSPTFLMAEGL